MTGITLLGLGPGNPKYLTCEARQWLESVSELYVIDKRHPVTQADGQYENHFQPD